MSGFGLDAHSMLGCGEDAVRFANTSDLDEYLGNAGASTAFAASRIRESSLRLRSIVIGRDEAFEESLFLGLRLNEGVDLNRLRGQFGEAMLRGCDACVYMRFAMPVCWS